MPVIKCPDCDNRLSVATPGARIKHHADGTHTFIPPTPPRAVTDPKPRGRRRA